MENSRHRYSQATHVGGILPRILNRLRQDGFGGLWKSLVYRVHIAWLRRFAPLLIRLAPKRKIGYGTSEVSYFHHPHNFTWRNERAIEIPIILAELQGRDPETVLEFGAVLHHYVPVSWDILDKFEVGTGIINEDAVTFAPEKKYDLIVSISTLEHVGLDDDVLGPGRVRQAVENLRGCLRPGGRMVVTAPLGKNPALDRLIHDEPGLFHKRSFFRKVSRNNAWKAVDARSVLGVRMGFPYRGVNALIIFEVVA